MKIVKSHKRVASPHPDLTQLINKICETPTDDLAAFIAAIPEWKWPRSDLGNWVKVLNKFDAILKETIRDYNVDTMHMNPFTPLTKATILEILRFERMLLENTTGRKLFASYDRLNSLLYSSDLDVVVASLKVILRPSQQYSAQPPSAQTSNISSARLLSIAQSWKPLRDQGIDLHDFLDAKKGPLEIDLSGESGDVHFQFYRKSDAKPTEPSPTIAEPTVPETPNRPAASGSSTVPTSPTVPSRPANTGLTIVHLPGVATSKEDTMTILAQAVEQYDVPEDERFALLSRIRIARALAKGHEEEREKLAVARLIAVAIYAHSHGENQALNTLFLYDPELISSVAELIHPDREIPSSVQVAALVALDGLGRYRSRTPEVLTAVNAGVSHGTLMSFLRKTVAQLQDASLPFNTDVSDALLSLLMLLTASPGGGTMIVGAGLIPLIVQIIDIKFPSRLPIVSKITVLLDNVIYGYGNAFQLFCNNSGVETLVGRIAHEVDSDIEEFGKPEDGTVPDSSYGSLSYARSSVLKHLLRSMHRMMQASGTSEGLRTLIDSSLPMSVKKIMANRACFGPPIFSIAINLMSIFIHNEPTSLSILQEAHIPETFYDAIEEGIEPALEVISALPNAIGALCLNPAGETQLAARTKIIPSIFETFTSEKHIKVLGEKENAIVIGTALDELVRHHPSLKPQVFEGIQNMLRRIEEVGQTWRPPKDEEASYFLRTEGTPPVASGSKAAPEGMDVEVDSETKAPNAEGDEAADDEHKDDALPKFEDNIIMNYIDVAAKLLEGLFQYAPHCKEFITKYEGIDLIGRIYKVPALPIRFSETPASDSLTQLFRTMTELNTKETLMKLSEIVRNALDESKEFWESTTTESRLSDFSRVEDAQSAALNGRFRRLVTLQIAISTLGDVYSSIGWSHLRGLASVVQVLSGNETPSILDDLGKTHRVFLWENILLKAEAPTTSQESSQSASASGSQPSAMVVADLPKPREEAERLKSASSTSATEANARVISYIVAQIPFSLTPFFQAVSKLFTSSRRSTDSLSKKSSATLAQHLARVLLDHCQWNASDDAKSLFAYGTLVISFITSLLRDERSPQSNLHTLLLIKLRRAGGIEAVVAFGERAAALVQDVSAKSSEHRSADDESALAHAYGLLNVVVHLLGGIVASRPLLESTQTAPLITGGKDKRDVEYFEPHDFLIRIRLATLPFLQNLWKSPWLSNAPLPVVKSILNAVVEIMAAEQEDGISDGIPEVPANTLQALQAQFRQAAAAPDENLIGQLADMGFSRSSAERALIRTRNNVNAAADLLLSHPHLFPMDPIPPAPAPAAAVPPTQEPAVDPAPPPPNDATVQAVSEQVNAEPLNAEPVQAEDNQVPPAPQGEPITNVEDEVVMDIGADEEAEVMTEDATPDPPPVLEEARDWKGELSQLRDSIRDDVISQAFSLVDDQPPLVFEVKTAYIRLGKLQKDKGLSFVLQVPESAPDQVISARSRLLALILNDASFPVTEIDIAETNKVMDIVITTIRRLPKLEGSSSQTLPKWLAPNLLVAEALLLLGDDITQVDLPIDEANIPTVDLYSRQTPLEQRRFIFDICLQLLSITDLAPDDTLATLRLLVLLTKDSAISSSFVTQNGISLLLHRFKASSKDTLMYRNHVFTILHHVVEDQQTVEALMKHHLKRFFALSRNRQTEAAMIVRNTSPLALRDPKLYISICRSTCKLAPLRPGSNYNVSMIPEGNGHGRGPKGESGDDVMQVDEAPKAAANAASVESLVHYLIQEVMQVYKAASSSEPTKEPSPATLAPPASQPSASTTGPATNASSVTTAPTSTKSEESPEYVYVCVMMQALAELLASYDSCKVAFVSFHKKRASGSKDQTPKHRPNFLAFLLSDVIAPHTLSTDNNRKKYLGNWAMAIILSLCNDMYSSGSSKDASEELTSSKKFVLDALAKAMRDAAQVEALDVRYGRMQNLAELCYRLLSVRAASASGTKEETNIHVAKIMLEKNYVSTLTAGLADVDVNYPDLKSLIGIITRPLEHLTKVAIKMGRASGKGKEGVPDQMETDSSSSEGPVEEEREETPDLYRNSALGMFGGAADMEDIEYENDDGEMVDDEDEDEEEMDFADDDSSGTEPSTEDEGEEVAMHDQDVGMDESPEHAWDDGHPDADGTEGEDDDDDDDDEGEMVDEGDILWQADPDSIGGADALGVTADIAEDGLNEDGDESVGSGDDQGDLAETPSDEEEFVLEFTDAAQAEADGGWIAPSNTWGTVPQNDAINIARQSHVLGARRSRLQDDAYTFGARRTGQPAEPASHPLLMEQAEPAVVEPTPSGARPSFRRIHHVTGGNGYLDLVQTLTDLVGGEGAQILNQLIVHGRGMGAEALQLDLTGEAGALLNTLERGLQHHSQHSHHIHHIHRPERRSRNQVSDVAQFAPLGTLQRWAEELKLFNPTLLNDRLSKLTGHLVIALLPAAIEAARFAKEEMERQESERKRAEEERLAAEEAKKEEERQRQAKEEDERQEIARRAEEEAAAAAAVAAASYKPEDTEMDISTDSNANQAEPSTAEQDSEDQTASGSGPARVTILVHGNVVDITDTGIDAEFLEALPDDMREEIINQHLRERRTVTQPEQDPESQISPEFLDALPPDIRAEILQQEVADRARRERDRAAAQGNASAGPSDMDTASFLATLDPNLRQAVLMEQDEDFLQTLPSAVLAGVNINPTTIPRRTVPRAAPPVSTPAVPPTKKTTAPKDAVQLLDKTGVATLVRLLFAPQAPKRSSIHKVLVNLCENSKTRVEVLNLLLTILQSNTADLSAVDRSFSMMSVRGNKIPSQKATPRKSTIEPTIAFVNQSAENIPNLVAQRCLEALVSLVTANELCTIFFLTEHELPAGLKRHLSKKGKGKEKPITQMHYPLVLLVSLLDKPTILKTPSLMEVVANLLSSVTRPLTTLAEENHSSESTSLAEPSQTQPQAQSQSQSEPAASQDPVPESPQVVIPEQPPTAPTETPKLLPSPPQIPHSVLRLVVSLLTVGECSARTFQQTLSLIQHLSHLPDARDTIASELKSKAQELGQSLYTDLTELQTSLEQSSSGDNVPSVVITKFSPASSDQAKLLRILKTIDYMYTTRSTASNDKTEVVTGDQEKAQVIYQSFRFSSLWRKLGDCLTLVEEKPDADHIAMVLLPLIESLMVVCKYVSGTVLQQKALQSSMSPRSPTTPRESTEDLFVSFTDSHRKVLNSMVRSNPSLMSGSFSLLVNNPRVLDFDNKRNYFTQKLRRRPTNREQYGTLQVNVRRARVFEDSFQNLQRQTGEQIKYGKLSVRFYDEEGVDAGGVTREWFQILARQMFNPDYALFQPCAADRLTYQPNQASWVNQEHLSFFKFVGRIIGKAIFDGRLLDAYFARSLYRQMLGKPVDYRDVEWVDPEYYKSLVWILDNDPTVLDLTFSVESNNFGLTKVIPLKENGQSIAVTNDNKREYVQLSAEYRLVKSIKDQIEAFLNGFYEIIPKDLIAIFNEQELELLISGTPDIDVDEWRAATDYTGYTSADPVIVWWWRALKSFNRDERAKVLSFTTGTSKVPLGGFTELQGVQGVQRFSIHKAYGEPDRLPQAHTCFNQIDLPQFTSYETLRKQLLLAINEGGEGFGFA